LNRVYLDTKDTTSVNDHGYDSVSL